MRMPCKDVDKAAIAFQIPSIQKGRSISRSFPGSMTLLIPFQIPSIQKRRSIT